MSDGKLTKEQLTEQIYNYLWRITHANDCLELYKTIHNATRTRLEEMNYAPCFFSKVRESIRIDLFMTTAKLFDNSKGTMSIKKLLDICSENKHCFPNEYKVNFFNSLCPEEEAGEYQTIKVDIVADIDDANKRLEGLQPQIKNLMTRRNKYYAHADKKYIMDVKKLTSEAPVAHNDIKELLSFASDVCNKLLCNLNQSRFFTQSSNVDDLMDLLDALHRSKARGKLEDIKAGGVDNPPDSW